MPIAQPSVAPRVPRLRPPAARRALKPCSSRGSETSLVFRSGVAAGRSRDGDRLGLVPGGIPMRPLTRFVCAFLAVLAFSAVPRPAPAATPETVNVSPGDAQQTWQTPLIV